MQVEIKIGYSILVADLSGAELEVFTRITTKLTSVEDRTSYEGVGQFYPQSESKPEWRITVNPVALPFTDAEGTKALQLKAQQVWRATLVKSLLEDPASVERRKSLADQLWYDSIWTQVMSKEFEVTAILADSVKLQAGGFTWYVESNGLVIKEG